MIEIEFEVGRWRADGFNIVKRHQHTNQLRLFSSALCVLCHDVPIERLIFLFNLEIYLFCIYSICKLETVEFNQYGNGPHY